MCICGPKVGKRVSLYDIDEDQKVKLLQRLPQLTEKRVQTITKHIVFQFLDNLAETIFTNGRIYTMNENNPIVECVAVRNGRILFAGKTS